MGVLAILWKFRTAIVITVAALSVLGFLKYHQYLKKELQETRAELSQAKAGWEKDVKKFNRQIELQIDELEREKKRKKAIVEQKTNEFEKEKKENDAKRKSLEDQLKANIKPTDTIIVPTVFERVYNALVERSSKGNGGDISIPKDQPDLSGKTSTFEASTFAHTVISNLAAYNSLALRCSKLIDIVVELEAKYGTNNERSKGQVGSDGGNAVGRTP